jgi:hypothetical protein
MLSDVKRLTFSRDDRHHDKDVTKLRVIARIHLAVELQAIDDLVDHLALGAHG